MRKTNDRGEAARAEIRALGRQRRDMGILAAEEN